MKNVYTCILGASLFALAMLSPIQAQTPFSIAYEFTGGSANPSTPSGNVSGDTATWNGFGANASFSGTSGTAYVRTDETGSTFNISQYLEVTISATGGETLNLSSLTFAYGGSNNASSTEFTAYASLRAGAPTDDFSTLTDLTLTPGPTTIASQAVPVPSSGSYTTFTADLSDAAYQGIESLTLRMYVYDDLTGGSGYDRINDITFTGTTAIPESDTAALISVVGVVLLTLIYRKRIRR